MAIDSERASNRATMAVLLSNPPYRRLFLARSVSMFGNQFTAIALAFGILALHGRHRASVLGFVFAASSVAMVACLLLGGVLADRFRRDRLLVVSDLTSGAVLFGLAWCFATGHASTLNLVVLSFVQGGVSAIRYPALTGLLPTIVDADVLQQANGMLRLATNVASIAGPALAAFVVSAAGTPTALVVDGVCYVCSVAFIAGLGLETPIPSGQSMLGELAHGWRAFTEHTWVWAIVAGFCLYNACAGGVFSVLAPIVMATSFHGAATWGTIMTVGAFGSVAGSALAIRLRPARPMVTGILWCTPGVAFTLGLAGPIPVVALAAIAFVQSIGMDVFGVLWESALQLHIEQSVLGRVSSYDWMGSLLATPIGLAIAGVVADHVGVRASLLGAGAICGVVVLGLVCVPSIATMTGERTVPVEA